MALREDPQISTGCSSSSVTQTGPRAATTLPLAHEPSLLRAVSVKHLTCLVAPTAVEPSLLRAVRVNKVLQCGVSSLRRQDVRDENHQQSFPTDHIDDFLSHDWGSCGLDKLFGVCLIYNSRAALIASVTLSYVLAALQYGPDPILPAQKPVQAFPHAEDERTMRGRRYGYWAELICPLVFAVFFLTWQDIKAFLRLRTRSAFVDKFCIDQANAERKAAGIFGLAGFLRCSDRFIILWTPRYFTRLWCTYEVASWLHLQKPLSSVLLMPLAHAQIVMTLSVAAWCGFVVIVLSFWFFPSFYLQAVAFGCLMALTIGAHQARRSTRHLNSLTEQLTNFSVTSAECSCCSQHHRGPSGEDIPCDREVVCSTITDWFGDDDGAPVAREVALERFNHAVRTKFGPKVLRMAGPTKLSYRYTVVASWSFFYRGCDVLAAADKLSPSYRWNAALVYPTVAMLAGPVFCKIAMHMACFLDKRIGIIRNRVADALLTLALGVIYAMTMLLVWVPLELLASLDAFIWPVALAALVYLVAVVALYHEDFREIAEQTGVPERVRTPRSMDCGKTCNAEHSDAEAIEDSVG